MELSFRRCIEERYHPVRYTCTCPVRLSTSSSCVCIHSLLRSYLFKDYELGGCVCVCAPGYLSAVCDTCDCPFAFFFFWYYTVYHKNQINILRGKLRCYTVHDLWSSNTTLPEIRIAYVSCFPPSLSGATHHFLARVKNYLVSEDGRKGSQSFHGIVPNGTKSAPFLSSRNRKYCQPLRNRIRIFFLNLQSNCMVQ